MKILLTSLSLLFLFINTLQAQTKAERIDSLLQESHKRGIFNGNALVAEKGDIVYQAEIGYADGSREKMLTPDLRFKIGSIGKEFDGVALMMLKEEGKIKLDDKISQYLPGLPEWSDKITIRHLLQYTSGLPKMDYDKIKDDEDIWKGLKGLSKLEFEPGTDYLYNNHNVFLRRRIVEKVTGESFNTFVENRMLKPGGMKNAEVDLQPDAPRYVKAFDNKFVEDDLEVKMTGWVQATINDMYAWLQNLHTYQLISKESLDELFEHYEPGQSPLGVGVYKEGGLLFHYHHGKSYNYEASIYHNVQDEFTVILMTNNTAHNVGDLTNAIDAILRGEAFEIPKKSIELTLRAEIFHEGFEKGIKLYEYIRQNEREIYDFKNEEKELAKTGSYLIETNKIKDGIEVLKFALTLYPNSSRIYTALGEGYQKQGQKERALFNYKKARTLNSENKQAAQMIEALEKEM